MSDVLIAFDLSTPIGSVALGSGGELIGRRYLLDPREQAARLVPTIDELLSDAGLVPGDLAGVVVGRGPGSFTGVRVAAASAKGFSAGLGIPVWPISSLAAGAVSLGATQWLPAAADPAPGVGLPAGDLVEGNEAAPRYVLFDAGGGRLYAAGYEVTEAAIETVLSPSATTIEALLEGELEDGALFMGDGALAHAESIEALDHAVLSFPAGIPTAGALLEVHRLRPGDEPELPGSPWQPDYIRDSSARAPRRPAGVRA